LTERSRFQTAEFQASKALWTKARSGTAEDAGFRAPFVGLDAAAWLAMRGVRAGPHILFALAARLFPRDTRWAARQPPLCSHQRGSRASATNLRHQIEDGLEMKDLAKPPKRSVCNLRTPDLVSKLTFGSSASLHNLSRLRGRTERIW